MKGKGIVIISVIMNIVLIVVMLLVKNNSQEEAKNMLSEFNEKFNGTIFQIDEMRVKNDALWILALEAYDTDKSFAAIKEFVNQSKFPELKAPGKGNDPIPAAAMTVSEVKADGVTNLKVGWEKYSIIFEFDKKAKLVKVNTSELEMAKDAVSQNKDTRDWSLNK